MPVLILLAVTFGWHSHKCAIRQNLISWLQLTFSHVRPLIFILSSVAAASSARALLPHRVTVAGICRARALLRPTSNICSIAPMAAAELTTVLRERSTALRFGYLAETGLTRFGEGFHAVFAATILGYEDECFLIV